MKKKILLLAIILLPMCASAQTYLKFNGLYWALGIINASVETKLNDKLTFNTDAVFSPWESVGGYPFLIGMLMPEVRYYTRKANDGFYLGAFSTIHTYKMSKWDHIRKNEYQKGWGYGFGASVGYQLPVSDRWNLDLYAGYGWVHGEYKGYYIDSGEKYTDWNGSGEWIPLKLGVSFSYRI